MCSQRCIFIRTQNIGILLQASRKKDSDVTVPVPTSKSATASSHYKVNKYGFSLTEASVVIYHYARISIFISMVYRTNILQRLWHQIGIVGETNDNYCFTGMAYIFSMPCRQSCTLLECIEQDGFRLQPRFAHLMRASGNG